MSAAAPTAPRDARSLTPPPIAGPLGALGPLGPLGPNGPSGFNVTASGDFIDSASAVVRAARVQFAADGNTWRVYRLVESYTAARAHELGFANDAAFMVDVALAPGQEECFNFTSTCKQTVSAVAGARRREHTRAVRSLLTRLCI